eukprot:CAMPEP_0182871282 /NCGR_PEP_ID=MMETSP0034_2-20130328/11028_1 /TAXON_ID=156128 /ORGANISM="Nephroselmis pyriformis, Strain CCMP717" /LENGTH=607 /DNA_ID=CAMNT_0025003827 /DNA_START=78 /DNA_END=1897 /DNA_ORIENTATION=+
MASAPPAAAAAPAAPAPAQGGANAPPAGNSSTSLYVGDLDPSVSEAQLYEVFSQVGPVVSIRVCRDLITRRSLGYAYVNYNSGADAQRAIDVLNFTPVNGKAVRIMYSQRDPSARKSAVGNIFIKNLDRTIDNKALFDTFQAFGPVQSSKIALDSQGQSKGYGFVQFDTEEAAQTAITKVNGMLLAGKQVYVGQFVRRTERETGTSKFSNIYVKNVAEVTTDEAFRTAFEKFGAITSCVIMRDEDGKSKGFGFVNFEDPECAMQAVEDLNGTSHDEKEWVVCRAQKKSEREAELKAKFEAARRERMEKYQGGNLYLKNLEDTVDDNKLREMFAEYGTITSCRVMRDSAGASKGSGFVAFSTAEEATRAVTEMNGKMAGQKPLYVALAQRKEERKARLQQQFQQRPGGPGMGAGGQMPMYPPMPGGPGGQMFFPGGPGGMMPPGAGGQGYGFPGGMMPGMRPGGPGGMPQYFMPVLQQRQGGQGRGRRGGANQGMPGGPQQQMRQGRQGQPPQGMPQQRMPQQEQQQMEPQRQGLAAQLASASPDQQRMMLGEALYPLVEAQEGPQAAKITGMLLEMDQSEVLHLIETHDALSAKVQEAVAVLQAADS